MAKLVDILGGDLTLIGPTTGLQGLFLGPLWYYIGVPGFLLSGGSPIGQSIWFICLSALAFPGFWWMSQKLFGTKEGGSEVEVGRAFGWLCLVLFIVLPGSLTSSIMIWNCLIGAPLMVGALFCFWKLRQGSHSLLWLSFGFFLIGLTLQSEFAYAIFFLPVFGVLIPWMMKRWKVLDFLVAGLSVGVTLTPQILFELKHQFLMTTSLSRVLRDSSKVVSWAQQFSHRPLQLLDTSVDFFNGPDQNSWLIRGIILAVCVIGVWSVSWVTYLHSKKKKVVSVQLYLRQLIVLFALVPYPFFLVWRGNNGNFFQYYWTPHFVFLTPLFVLGLEYIAQQLWKRELWGKLTTGIITTGVLLPLTLSTVEHWTVSVYSPVNQAGYETMITAVETTYKFQASEKSFTLVLTPNISSIHYDYLFNWYGKKHHLKTPRTVIQNGDTQMILVIEQWGPELSDYVKDRRKKLTEGWTKKRVVFSGMITVEEWIRS